MDRFTRGDVTRWRYRGRMSTTARSTRTVASIVGGTVQTGAPGGTATSTNPADTSEVVAEVRLGDAGTFVAACETARAAQPAWAAVPAPIRGRAIQQIGRLVEDNKEALARLVTREVGKPYAESLGEVQEIVDTCNFFLGEGRRLYGQTVPSEMPDKQLFTFRVPVGVAAIVTAGNFPVAVPSWYLVPALLCGNAVVWKPAEYAPAIGEAMAELFLHGGLPDGVLNVVLADGAQTYDGLEQALGRGLVDKVGFTGSSAVGARIGELCGRHLQSPCLELGGKNPLVVMDDADLDLAVEGALFSGFGTAGQRCTSLGTAIVHDAVHDEFLERFALAVEQAPVGDPARDVLYGPMIHERFLERFEADALALIRDHHELHGSTGTGRITSANPRDGFVGDDPERGLFCHPTIVSGVRIDDEIANTETFGPLVGVARFGSFEEAVELANAHGYGLSASIYTTSPKHAFRFRERVSAGMVSVNNSTSGAEAHLPFGGNGRSGNGSRQSGIWVLDQFTRWQALNWDYAGRLQKAQMDVADVEADLSFRLED
jgi:aldehyde dehydrogenase (NAD+)